MLSLRGFCSVLSCGVIVSLCAIARSEETFDYNLYETPPKPAPAWVTMVDLGLRDPALKGYRAPAGVKVEVVAREPDVINPVAFRFTDEGTLLLLEWQVGHHVSGFDTTITFKDGTTRPTQLWVKDVTDHLTALTPNTNGSFSKSGVIMNDLQLPSSVLVHDGWYYFTTRGSIIRRKQSVPGPGKPFDIQETIVHGLAGFNQHQASGLTMSPDGWLFFTNGDDDSHAEGADGKRIDQLRSGAVWRVRPDGSNLSLYARGFRNPYRDVAFDSFGNIFHTDNDNEDGSKFQGCRLMHVMGEADYGWRLKPSVRCCWPDADRGAIYGEKPGRMPPMVKTGRGAPCGVMIYQGTAFPNFFRGLIIYPDVFQRNVRCYSVERDGCTFKVTSQFTLLETTDGFFRPCEAAQGPDGAIYLCDWRTNSAGPAAAWGDGKHGRIWRLSWEGTPENPAIALGPMDAWAKVRSAEDASLLKLLDSADYEVRTRAADELHKRGDTTNADLVDIALDIRRSPETRAAAIAAAKSWGTPAHNAFTAAVTLATDENPQLRRMVYERFSREARNTQATSQWMDWATAGVADKDPAPRRAAALLLGRLAAYHPADESQRNAAKLLRDVLRHDASHDRFLHDGLLRGLERIGKTGIDLLVDAALSNDPAEREFGVTELECLRTRDAAAGFDRVISSPNALSEAQLARLLTAYRYIEVDPPIDPATLARWLETHSDAPPAEQVAALESLALIGQTDAAAVIPVVERLLKSSNAPTRLAVVKVIGEQHLLPAAKPLVDGLKDSTRTVEERQAILSTLGKLRGQKRFAQITFDPGVDAYVDALLAIAQNEPAPELRHDALALLAQIDFKKALPLVEKLLDTPADASAAINILGADAGATRKLARRFVDGKLPLELLPQVAAALQRQINRTHAADLTDLRASVMNRGLLIATDPAGIKRVEELVHTHGDATRGKALYLNQTRLACVTCHRLEGVGGQVGPDLTNLYQNVTIPKLIESILEPSKEIKEGYETWMVQTKDGESYEGLKISGDAQRTVLRDSTGRTITIPAGNIQRIAASKVSLMPEGLTATLSLDEFADLLAFLMDGRAQATLRTPPK